MKAANRILLVSSLLALLLLASASAHAVPNTAKMTPQPGARLLESPSEIRVPFTEVLYNEICTKPLPAPKPPCSGLQIWTDGKQWPTEPSIDASTSTLILQVGELEHGAYEIRWQTFSETDGHVVGGVLGFSVGSAFDPPAGVSYNSESLGWPSILGKTMLYFGLALAIGSLFYHASVVKRPGGLIFVAAGGGIGLIGASLQSVGAAGGFGSALAEYFATDHGALAAKRLALLLGAGLLSLIWGLRQNPSKLQLLLIAIPIIAASWLTAQYGHASQHGAWLVFVEFIHLLSVSAWLGSLPQLLKGEGPLVARFERFTSHGFVLAGVALFTGTVLSLAILLPVVLAGSWSSLLTLWTGILVLKIGFFAVVVYFANENRVLGKGGSAKQALKPEIRAALPIFLLVGLLMSSGAPAALDESTELVLEADEQNAAARIIFETTPHLGEPISAKLQLLVLNPETNSLESAKTNTCSGDDSTVPCVTLRWDSGSGEQSRDAIPDGKGAWLLPDLQFFAERNQSLRLFVSTEYFYEEVLYFNLKVSP